MTHRNLPFKIMALIAFMFIFFIGFTGMLRLQPAKVIGTKTNGDTRYVVSRKYKFNNNSILYFNPFGAKDHYTVEVQKAKTDKHGIKVWKYDKTVDYGTHKPNIAN